MEIQNGIGHILYSRTLPMQDFHITSFPQALDPILRDTERIGFTMGSDASTGTVLRALAASKPGGRLLELGTGTGIATAWLLQGMDESSRLESVDNDPEAQEIARRHLGDDRRLTFHLEDAAVFLEQPHPHGFDLIFADAWPGKFPDRDLALSHLRLGGVYLIDDLLPQPNWPEGHGDKVTELIADLERRPEFVCTKLAWGSGLMIVVRRD
jgi:predicted O-methyltransferase YrrM